MRALVVGHGSIGSRHARILKELGSEVAVVSSRDVSAEPCYGNIAEAIAEFGPDYVVVATATSRHGDSISDLIAAGFRGLLLVEKPLFHTITDIPPNGFRGSFVGYNLRFHPMMQRLRELLRNDKIISVQAYVGQYLPLWRPDRDYRSVYSADKQAGGGVLRDLSHELDMLNWILGGWQELIALGGHFSQLEINSDDLFSIIMKSKYCPVAAVQMNYLDRLGRRRIIVNTEARTFEADFITGQLWIDGDKEEYIVERDKTYHNMHSAILNGHWQDACSLDEGFDVVRMIEAAEQSVEERRWIAKC